MDPETSRRMQAAMDAEVKTMKAIQQKLTDLVPLRQKLLTQYNENTMVKKEFDLIADDDDSTPVYKLVGPVLVRQEIDEAKSNVDNRIKYFKAEIERIDKQETDLIDQRNVQSSQIQKIQDSARAMYQQAVSRATQQPQTQ